MRIKLNNRKGSALALVLIVMAVLMILGTTVLKVAVAEDRFANHNEDKIQAYYVARAGAQAVAEYMIEDAHGDASELVDMTSDMTQYTKMGGQFQVTVSKNPSNNNLSIISTGEYNGIKQTAKILLEGSASGVGGIFNHALAVKDGITVSNEAGQGITVTGTVASNGDIDLGGNSTLESSKIFKYQNLIFPPIVVPAGVTVTNLGTIELKKGNIPTSLSVSSGGKTYYSADSITIQNNSINVTGKGSVHLYVYGNIDLNTQSKFNVDRDVLFYIYVVGQKTISFAGSGDQNNLMIYAPDSIINWNNAQSGDFFGALIGKSIILANQTVIKYNPAMGNEVELDKTGIGVTYKGYSWLD